MRVVEEVAVPLLGVAQLDVLLLQLPDQRCAVALEDFALGRQGLGRAGSFADPNRGLQRGDDLRSRAACGWARCRRR
jgi:hypothetical protein